MKKISFIIFFIIISILYLNAQTLSRIKFASFEPLFFNPAYGYDYQNITISLLNKIQWSGLPYNPKESYLVFTYPYKSNMGFNFTSGLGTIGINNNLDFEFNYFYHILLANTTHLSFGFGGQLNYYQINIKLLDNGEIDPALQNIRQKTWFYSINTGIHLQHRFFNFGTAIFNITNNHLQISDSLQYSVQNFAAIFYANYTWQNITGSFALKPKLTFLYQDNNLLMQSGFEAVFIKYLSLGIDYTETFQIDIFAYRSLSFPIKMQIKNFAIGLYYETCLGSVSSLFGSSYGLSLSYRFKGKQKIPSYF